ncbi:hypothetical protein NP493_2512g00001 [Ridgeia piscesae]|uniref:Uncharacterized protein n=1 Tax=Ridgeia piscesae TaxID=27915 RepID=A0AAD9N0E0_RIDPI|nr:hypothetical protein NP493_2512g00001 [Ridgeia piscesae]
MLGDAYLLQCFQGLSQYNLYFVLTGGDGTMALARTSGQVLANPDNMAVFCSGRKQLELQKTLQLYVYLQIHQPMADRKRECEFRPLVNVASACYSPLHFGFRRVLFTSAFSGGSMADLVERAQRVIPVYISFCALGGEQDMG